MLKMLSVLSQSMKKKKKGQTFVMLSFNGAYVYEMYDH